VQSAAFTGEGVLILDQEERSGFWGLSAWFVPLLV
jgi:hypothetical protein